MLAILGTVAAAVALGTLPLAIRETRRSIARERLIP